MRGGAPGTRHAGCTPGGLPALACRSCRWNVTGSRASGCIRSPPLPTSATACRCGHLMVGGLGAACLCDLALVALPPRPSRPRALRVDPVAVRLADEVAVDFHDARALAHRLLAP